MLMKDGCAAMLAWEFLWCMFMCRARHVSFRYILWIIYIPLNFTKLMGLNDFILGWNIYKDRVGHWYSLITLKYIIMKMRIAITHFIFHFLPYTSVKHNVNWLRRALSFCSFLEVFFCRPITKERAIFCSEVGNTYFQWKIFRFPCILICDTA